MARRLTNRFYKAVSLITVLMLLSSTVLSAQNDKTADVRKSAIKNLVEGINSDNTGLKKSCIYMAGRYKLQEMLDVLSEKLEDEKDADVRVLIALSLYQIGLNKGIDAVKEAAIYDKDLKVRKICAEIYNAFVENSYTISEKY